MKKFLQQGIYAVYLGMAVGAFTAITFRNWEFYAILIPVILLVELGHES